MAGRQAVKAYLDLVSQACRAVLIFLKHNKIPHTVENIAIRKGQHKTPEFTKLNPMQKLPVLEDNGFVLTESRKPHKHENQNVFSVLSLW
ncbi:glutathione S-transferase theta-1-like isoform X1 [Sinocyclocheilus anshuiensis]|uniref:glutathione S-transferase theta-1-like isoform X1 n=1 Tax=Sinocyclocheilus anshuiensis TaxID=1608454 RepID=UPI0007BAC042|nr:PREDICTED: glutathione S-transferase theta-1-like isoform X1 [Sinocyclocheilus anshuiensis]